MLYTIRASIVIKKEILMKKCDNNASGLKKDSQCNREVQNGFWSSSRSLKGDAFEWFFCSGKCREEFKKFHKIEVYDRSV